MEEKTRGSIVRKSRHNVSFSTKLFHINQKLAIRTCTTVVAMYHILYQFTIIVPIHFSIVYQRNASITSILYIDW